MNSASVVCELGGLTFLPQRPPSELSIGLQMLIVPEATLFRHLGQCIGLNDLQSTLCSSQKSCGVCQNHPTDQTKRLRLGHTALWPGPSNGLQARIHLLSALSGFLADLPNPTISPPLLPLGFALPELSFVTLWIAPFPLGPSDPHV